MSADTEADRLKRDPPLAVLDVVRDREDADADDAVVVNTPPIAAEEWIVRGGVSVADENPQYDDTADVIVVAFREELEEARPTFTEDTDALRLAEADDVDTYAFPPGRLRRVASICPKDGDARAGARRETKDEGATPTATASGEEADEPPLRDDLDAIAAAVRERNVDAVAVDTFREAVVVEKLGVEYLITRDGAVDADDRIAEELEAAAEGVVGE